MADFPWQKPSPKDGDDARFPWQKTDASSEPEAESSEPDAPTKTPASASSMPWKRQDPPAEAPKATVVREDPAPDPRVQRAETASAAHDDAVEDASAPTDATEQAGRQRAAFMRAAQQQGTAASDTGTPAPSASSSMPWQNHDEEPEPSTFTPPWQPEAASTSPSSRPHAKKPRPTPRASAAAPAAAAAKVRVPSGRAGRVVGTVVFSAVAAVIALGVGAALFMPMFGSSSPSSGTAGADPSPTPTVIPRATDEVALEVANAFVDALVAGDADAAAAMLGVTASGLTSAETWKSMLEAYPISDVNVTAMGKDSWDDQLVEVDYTMNEQSVSFMMTIDVDLTTPENTVIDYDLPTLHITDGYEGFDITLNGVPLANPSDSEHDIFPGSYTVSTTTAYFAIESDPIVASEGINFLYPYEHEPALTDEGVTKFRDVVRAAVEGCISTTTLEAGCGLTVSGGLAGGGSIVDGSVERTISDEQWTKIDEMIPTTDSWDGGLVQEGNSIGPVSFFADWNQNGRSGRDEIHGGPWLDSPHVDFADPEFTVTWDY